MMKVNFVLVFLSLGFVFSCNSKEKGTENKQPNFLFILVDDLGYADLGYTGSTFYETPNIDLLASQGMVFTNAYAAAPVCSPSRAAIMSGKYPATLNLTDYIPGNRSHGPHADQRLASKPFKLALDTSVVTIAEDLKKQGYKTFFAGKWHLGEEEKYFPDRQGFDYNIAGNGSGHPSGGYFSPYKNPQLSDGLDGEYLTDRLVDETIRFLNKSHEAPFFAFLSFYTVHLPMQGKPEKVKKYQDKWHQMAVDGELFVKEGKTYIKQVQNMPHYAAMVESMDENVGRVLQTLERSGISENTVVFFTSDNGGMATSNRTDNIPTSNLPLRAGKGYLYEGGIHEPLIIKWPEKIKAGTNCNVPVTGTDFYPTLLEMAGLSVPNKKRLDGTSLTLLLKGKTLAQRPIFWHYPHYSGGLGGRPSGAVRLGDFKLIEFYEDMHVELYNLKTDIEEKNDLSEIEVEKTKELIDLLHTWRNDTNALMPYPNPAFKEEH